MTNTKRWRKIQELYRRVPEFSCRGLCTPECSIVPVHPLEYQHLEQASGRHLPIHHRDDGMLILLPTFDGRCPLLERGRCIVHEVRPLICRLYGATAGGRCPHGCRPQRIMPDEEAFELLRQLSKL